MAVQKKPRLEQQINEEGLRFLGKHISREKALALLCATLLACAMPMVMGARYWADIPELLETGLTGVNGEDDSLPRWAVVFVIPGLMCLLNGIAHGQLMLHQARKRVPPKQIRVVGRWGVPIVGIFLSSAVIRWAAGLTALPTAFLLSCALSLALLLLGGHLWDCPMDAALSLRLIRKEGWSEEAAHWDRMHRFAGTVWLAAGLLVLLDTMLCDRVSALGATALLAALILSMLAAGKRG